ncbi:zinc finger and SCAN domain-containing protein 12-like isoform X2 [Centroberyx affinis]|uniref:zinc finger and SCAN domain-containing protein 12-like isoform X2 n=1 Tax=Centroberyx affinis TaxID=166261 RepID=UPI003A5BB8EE
MSKVQKLRALVNQRLTAAAEEIFGLFERTIAEYEEEASRSKEEIDRQRKLLDAVLNPEVRLHRADLQQLLVSKEEVPPEQQEWSPSLDQEDPEPPHIKEEQEELWTSQEGEQLQGLEEADITKFPSTSVPVKSEDDEEKPQSSQLHQSQTEENREAEPLASSSTEQMKTEADGEDCGVSEPARNLDPASDLQPTSDGKTSDSSEPETEDSNDYWMETSEPQSGSDSRQNSGQKRFSCSVCGNRFGRKATLLRHMIVHTGRPMRYLQKNAATGDLERGLKNKWRWQWLEETDSQGQRYDVWLAKVDIPGMAWCKLCSKNIAYAQNGKKVFARHTEDHHHREMVSQQQYTQTLPGVWW